MADHLPIERKKLIEPVYAAALSGVAIYFHDYPYWIQAVVDWLQFGLISVLLILAIKDEQEFGTRTSREGRAVAQFLHFWKRLWFVWLMLYMVFATDNTFKAIHTEPSDAHALSADDIADWGGLCSKFYQSSDPISKMLMTRFSQEASNAVVTIGFSGSATSQQEDVVLKQLNAVISGPSIYDTRVFPPPTLHPSIRRLSKQKLQGVQLAHFNLLLLEEVYPRWLRNNRPPNSEFWNSSLDLIANLANNIQSSYMLLLFLVMTKETTDKKEKRIRLVRQGMFVFVSVAAALEFWFTVCSPIVYDKGGETPIDTLATISGITFSTVSGLLAGVVFCLFFGRLGSHYIGISVFWVAALYMYATIQPLYPLFRVFDTYSSESQQVLQTVQIGLKILAGVLKLVLFLRVREVLRDLRLLFFMRRIADDDKTLDVNFQTFQREYQQ